VPLFCATGFFAVVGLVLGGDAGFAGFADTTFCVGFRVGVVDGLLVGVRVGLRAGWGAAPCSGADDEESTRPRYQRDTTPFALPERKDRLRGTTSRDHLRETVTV